MLKTSESAFLSSLTRREFLRRSACVAAGASLASRRAAAEAPKLPDHKLRAAIIGDTGHGNYGHEHDLVFNGRESITVVAVADPDEAGRAKAADRTHALRQYADYRQMMEQ
jgi:hypothetical protein